VKLSEEVFVKVQQIWLINPLALKACYSWHAVHSLMPTGTRRCYQEHTN
jgi:hypothetical protein